MIRVLYVLAALLFAVLAATPAQSATAIAYAEAENTYGWCAGYTTSEAPGCAQEWCRKSGGGDCRIALVCDAGWNSVAFADTQDASGFGASCDMGSAHDARVVALSRCIEQARTICWTSSTFNGQGEERSEDENRTFDQTWYIQVLLHGIGYDAGTIDGAFGNRTRTAIRSFQADLGIAQTGELSDDLLYMLLTRNGGLEVLVSDMETLIGTFSTDEVSRSFGRSYTPHSNWSISRELAKRTTTVQRVMLAQLLRMNDYDCPMPARDTQHIDPATGTWLVTCSNNRDFEIEFRTAAEVYITDLVAEAAPPAPPPVQPQQQPQQPPPPPQQTTPPPPQAPAAPGVAGKSKG
jgi:peptidoglycan hydrolase-like protein with peptidoglycan-binding domain